MRAAIVLGGLALGLMVLAPTQGTQASVLAQATATPTSTATPTPTATPHCQIEMRRGTLATPTWQTVPWWFETWGGGTC